MREEKKNSHAEMTKKCGDVFSPLVIALDYILYLGLSEKRRCEEEGMGLFRIDMDDKYTLNVSHDSVESV